MSADPLEREWTPEEWEKLPDAPPLVPEYRLWVNPERTVLARLWASGTMEVATREDPSHPWGPPVQLEPGQRV